MTRIRNITDQLINHEILASVGRMAVGIAHGINTQLGIIPGHSRLMMDEFRAQSGEYCVKTIDKMDLKIKGSEILIRRK